MRSFSNPDGLTLTDSPGCFWFFGFFFCLVGGAAFIAAISSGFQEHSLGQTLITAALGLAAIGAGIYIIYNAPASRVVISRSRNLLTVSQRGLLRQRYHAVGHLRNGRVMRDHGGGGAQLAIDALDCFEDDNPGLYVERPGRLVAE